MSHSAGRTVVVSGGTDGMGKELALARARLGERVVAVGSNAEKGRALVADGAGRVEFVRADLTSLDAVRGVIDEVRQRVGSLDALVLFANRQAPRRRVTADGLESTFALYYVSRYLLSHGLRDLLAAAPSGVVVNVAGVGMTAGGIRWDDVGLERRYSTVRAQLQAGRANDLLGVSFAREHAGSPPYVLYHPGFTRSGDLSVLPLVPRLLVGAAARVAARSVASAVAPIHGFLDAPPALPLTAVDRSRVLPLTLPTLDPDAADRLRRLTEDLLAAADARR